MGDVAAAAAELTAEVDARTVGYSLSFAPFNRADSPVGRPTR